MIITCFLPSPLPSQVEVLIRVFGNEIFGNLLGDKENPHDEINTQRQSFSVALEPVLELAPVDQAGLELTEIHLPLPCECWD